MKTSYKVNLAKAWEDNASLFVGLSDSMQSRLDRVYSAFSGTYEYTDSHTGKTVKARTYKKRLSFAEKEIEAVKTQIALQYRYGKISDKQQAEVVSYIDSLYSAAIKDNSYLKENSVRKSAQSRRVSDNILFIGPSLEQKVQMHRMRAGTGYTNALQEKVGTISEDLARLKAEEGHKLNPFEKLPEGVPSPWPISREDEERAKNNYSRPGFLTRIGKLARLVAGFSLAFLASDKPLKDYSPAFSNSPIIYGVNPDSLAEEPEKVVALPNIDPNKPAEYMIDQATLDYEARLAAQPPVVPVKSTLEQSNQRNERAWSKVREYEAQIARQNYRAKKIEEGKKIFVKQTETNFKQEKIGAHWKESFYRKWEEKSRQRSLDNIVTKVVTYAQDGKITIEYPQTSAKYVLTQKN